jgi:hypothetical protein
MLGGSLVLKNEAGLKQELIGVFMLFTFLIVSMTEFMLVEIYRSSCRRRLKTRTTLYTRRRCIRRCGCLRREVSVNLCPRASSRTRRARLNMLDVNARRQKLNHKRHKRHRRHKRFYG